MLMKLVSICFFCSAAWLSIVTWRNYKMPIDLFYAACGVVPFVIIGVILW